MGDLLIESPVLYLLIGMIGGCVGWVVGRVIEEVS